MIERQELYCHDCDKYVQFDIDLSLNGNHVLNCPNCDHEHCRVVKNGKITDIRWDQRNKNVYVVTGASTSSVSTWATAGSTGNVFTYQLWMNTTSTS